jgi:hypothetical protein
MTKARLPGETPRHTERLIDDLRGLINRTYKRFSDDALRYFDGVAFEALAQVMGDVIRNIECADNRQFTVELMLKVMPQVLRGADAQAIEIVRERAACLH